MKKALFTENNHCMLCPHNCNILEGKRGLCGVRINKDNTIYSLNYGKPCTLSIDPIEKKPLFHFYPGRPIFSLGTYGCNFFCSGCQNFEIARKIPDEKDDGIEYSSKDIVKLAKEKKCDMIAYTYNEPTVFYEYMLDIAKEAKKNNIKNVIVSNGYINEEPLKKLIKYIDAANIDLKIFDEKNHLRYTSGKLENVLRTLKILKDNNVWLEITHLMIPGWNDSLKDFEEMCVWIKANLGEKTPLHISRFFPHYKLNDTPATPIELLMNAKNIGDKYLKYVYIGNISDEENTYCPNCKTLIVKRAGYNVEDKTINNGVCSLCKKKILIK